MLLIVLFHFVPVIFCRPMHLRDIIRVCTRYFVLFDNERPKQAMLQYSHAVPYAVNISLNDSDLLLLLLLYFNVLLNSFQ